jgi:hypothetical protein
METKICSKCGVEKKVCEYYKKKGCLFGVNSYCKKCQLEIKQNLRKNNPEKYKEQTKKYYEKTKDTQKEKKKIWILNNREKYNSYWTNRKKEDIEFKLITDMRSRLSTYLSKKGLSKKNKTFEIVGCSPLQLREHLEKQFVIGMTWNNRGEWHIDHIIPLSSAKTEEELYKLFHYTNLQPLWAIENIKKSNKILSNNII